MFKHIEKYAEHGGMTMEELLRKGYKCNEKPELGLNPDEYEEFCDKCNKDDDEDDGREDLGLGAEFIPF